MDITHLGHSSFKIRGKKATVVTDPFNADMTGIKFPKVEADIVCVSHGHDDHNFIEGVSGEKVVIEGPGEYEVKGVKITGIASYHDSSLGKERGKNTIYRIEIDDISVVHLGDLGHKLNDGEVEQLDGIDVLMIPVGGIYTIDSAQASAFVAQLEPSIIIPMHYKTPELNEKIFGKMEELSVFLKAMGKEGVVSVPKLSISKDKIGAESTVVVLE